MFIQHLASESQTQAKLERKPRRNIQYKDVGTFSPSLLYIPVILTPPANAVSHQDNLEFLEDVVPKTVPYKKIKVAAAKTQARLRGENVPDDKPSATSGTTTNKSIVNGGGSGPSSSSSPFSAGPVRDEPGAQLDLEMRQAAKVAATADEDDADVAMTG